MAMKKQRSSVTKKTISARYSSADESVPGAVDPMTETAAGSLLQNRAPALAATSKGPDGTCGEKPCICKKCQNIIPPGEALAADGLPEAAPKRRTRKLKAEAVPKSLPAEEGEKSAQETPAETSATDKVSGSMKELADLTRDAAAALVTLGDAGKSAKEGMADASKSLEAFYTPGPEAQQSDNTETLQSGGSVSTDSEAAPVETLSANRPGMGKSSAPGKARGKIEDLPDLSRLIPSAGKTGESGKGDASSGDDAMRQLEEAKKMVDLLSETTDKLSGISSTPPMPETGNTGAPSPATEGAVTDVAESPARKSEMETGARRRSHKAKENSPDSRPAASQNSPHGKGAGDLSDTPKSGKQAEEDGRKALERASASTSEAGDMLKKLEDIKTAGENILSDTGLGSKTAGSNAGVPKGRSSSGGSPQAERVLDMAGDMPDSIDKMYSLLDSKRGFPNELPGAVTDLGPEFANELPSPMSGQAPGTSGALPMMGQPFSSPFGAETPFPNLAPGLGQQSPFDQESPFGKQSPFGPDSPFGQTSPFGPASPFGQTSPEPDATSESNAGSQGQEIKELMNKARASGGTSEQMAVLMKDLLEFLQMMQSDNKAMMDGFSQQLARLSLDQKNNRTQ